MICPQCGRACERDEVDNGVGMEPAGPYVCPYCCWVEPCFEWAQERMEPVDTSVILPDVNTTPLYTVNEYDESREGRD
jgi:hypothetical protein